MNYIAEYVGSGHPDRLSDQIVHNIVVKCIEYDERSLCEVECSLYKNEVYLTGRIACGNKKCLINKKIIKDIVRKVYKESKYTKDDKFEPYVENLKIIINICFDKLTKEERELRSYSDDQAVCVGYANILDECSNIPVEQYLIIKMGTYLDNIFSLNKNLGKDFKILVDIKEENNIYSWNKLTVSILHNHNLKYIELFEMIYKYIIDSLKNIFPNDIKYKKLLNIEKDKVLLNGAGDFHVGGPMGDNGLSGKKLVIDYYGPRVTIGGGAIFGKDPHKIDVCGTIAAREIALKVLKKYMYQEVMVKLGFSPGDLYPISINIIGKDNFGFNKEINENIDLKEYSIDNIFIKYKELFNYKNRTIIFKNIFKEIKL